MADPVDFPSATTPPAGRTDRHKAGIFTLLRNPRALWRFLRDPNAPVLPRIVAPVAVAYVVMPIDFIPDFIPFFGEVDDVFVLVLALQRLIENAGRVVLLDHWTGQAADLADLNLRGALTAAAFFLPKRIRRRLRVIGHG
jgi:uncharacterized membrane protein YkvA (DUF1232 family)